MDIDLGDIRAALIELDKRREQLVKDAIGAELLQLESWFDENIMVRADAAKEAMKALEKPQKALGISVLNFMILRRKPPSLRYRATQRLFSGIVPAREWKSRLTRMRRSLSGRKSPRLPLT